MNVINNIGGDKELNSHVSALTWRTTDYHFQPAKSSHLVKSNFANTELLYVHSASTTRVGRTRETAGSLAHVGDVPSSCRSPRGPSARPERCRRDGQPGAHPAVWPMRPAHAVHTAAASPLRPEWVDIVFNTTRSGLNRSSKWGWIALFYLATVK